MKRMEEKILAEGVVMPHGVLMVGSFLNQQIDTRFLVEVGEEIARLFKDSGATKIFTVEASGIALAVVAGIAMDLPVVFAKKNRQLNVNVETYSSMVYSFTHGADTKIVVSKEYIKPGEKLLLVDDFLAHGSALNGLIAIAEDAGAEVVGCCVAIEKSYQNGGDNLRARGYRVESLAIIDQLVETDILFK